MKNLIIVLVGILLAFLQVNAQVNQPVKHALIIAIGNYQTDSTGWPKISSKNDIDLVKSALQHQKFDDISVIQDKQATKKGIINAIRLLTLKVSAGDVAVIHFSSHGQEVQDYNRDEANHLDEAIVSYDAPVDMEHASFIGFKKGEYTNQNHFIDDDFGLLMDTLRTRLGPNGDLVVFIDACHSGTFTRGVAKVRGGFPPIVREDFQTTSAVLKNPVFLFQNENIPNLAHYVVFSATRANELNFEIAENITGYGSLSWALSKALTECVNGATYRGLFAEIQSIMYEKVPSQHPTIEGDIDRALFGGKYVTQEPYMTIALIKNDNTIVINGGKLIGIYDSTKVELYKAGTIETKGAQALATGYITKADNLVSTVVFTNKLTLKDKTDAWVFIKEKTFPDIRVNVAVGSFSNNNLKSWVIKYLDESKIIKRTDVLKSELIIEQPKQKGTASLAIRYAQDSSFYLRNLEKDSLDKVMLSYIQAKFIRELDIKNPDYNIDITFIPVKKNKNTKEIGTLKLENFIVNGTIEFPEGTEFYVKLKNKGSKTCYFSILDIQPDGIINAVAPTLKKDYDKPPEFFQLLARDSMTLPYSLIVYPPYGKELYKVFASEYPIDMSFIVSTRGSSEARGQETPLEKIFRETYNKESIIRKRGTEPDDLQLGNFGTTDVPFVIKPK